MLTLITALLVFYLGLFSWSARRDHDTLINAGVATLNSLDNLRALYSPFGIHDITKWCSHLLDIYETRMLPLETELKQGIWRLKLLGYDNIVNILDEHESLVSEFLKDIQTAKFSENRIILEKYYDRESANKNIDEVQEKIKNAIKQIADRPYHFKFCKITRAIRNNL